MIQRLVYYRYIFEIVLLGIQCVGLEIPVELYSIIEVFDCAIFTFRDPDLELK